MEIVLKGWLMGFCIAAPVGPIGLLCIRRSMTDGRLAGFVSGLGAATADALYGSIAALGLTAITQFLLNHREPIQLAGGLFLVGLGVAIMRAKPSQAEPQSTRRTATLAGAYGSTFALTLTNPATILSFVGIFTGLGFGSRTAATGSAVALVLGVFLGSAMWWLILSAAAGWLGSRVDAGRLRVINVASGALIAAFGVWQTSGLFWR